MGLFPRSVVSLEVTLFENQHRKRKPLDDSDQRQNTTTSSQSPTDTSIMDPMYSCTSQVGYLSLDIFTASALPTIHENVMTGPTDMSSTASSIRRSSSIYSADMPMQHSSPTSCSSASARFSSHSNSSSFKHVRFEEEGESTNDSFFDFDSDSESEDSWARPKQRFSALLKRGSGLRQSISLRKMPALSKAQGKPLASHRASERTTSGIPLEFVQGASPATLMEGAAEIARARRHGSGRGKAKRRNAGMI